MNREEQERAALIISSVNFAKDNINAAQDNNNITDVVTEAQILKDREVDETGRPNAIAIRVGRAVADEVKA